MDLDILWDRVYKFGTDGLEEGTIDEILKVIEEVRELKLKLEKVDDILNDVRDILYLKAIDDIDKVKTYIKESL
jgi:hypothetical protein